MNAGHWAERYGVSVAAIPEARVGPARRTAARSSPPSSSGSYTIVRRRLAHATNATPWRRTSLAHGKGIRRPRLRLARSGTLDRLRQVDRVYAMGYTHGVAKTVPVREFRSRLSELLSDVADRRDHVLVTRNGKPAAVLVPIDEYEALEETAEILSDSATLAAIEAGLAELSREKTVTLAELRAELAHRRTTR